MAKTLFIDGLAIELTRKKIKRVNMRVKSPDGRICISAPYGVPEKDIISFVREKRSWIDKSISKVRTRSENNPAAAPVSAAEKERLRRNLRRRIAVRLPLMEQKTGLRSNGWTVRDSHTRWGSCNTKTHHINFSLMLAARSDEELDYVILHELVHTIVPNHGPDFYAVMDRFMPGWKDIRRKMNR